MCQQSVVGKSFGEVLDRSPSSMGVRWKDKPEFQGC